MIICFRQKDLQLLGFKNCTIPLIESEANRFRLACRIKGAARKYPCRVEYEFSRENITQIIHRCFWYEQLLPLKMHTFTRISNAFSPYNLWGKCFVQEERQIDARSYSCLSMRHKITSLIIYLLYFLACLIFWWKLLEFSNYT